MKKLLLPILFTWTVTVFAQNVTIPDPNFKAALIAEGVDTNQDGEIQTTEAETITDIYYLGLKIFLI